MVATLQDGLNWGHSTQSLPASSVPAHSTSEEMLMTTRALARREHDDARYLRQLASRERHLNDGLFSLLLEAMALDKEKHERILRFVLARMEAGR
jgi:hypothetical protein